MGPRRNTPTYLHQTLESWDVRCDKLVWAYDTKGFDVPNVHCEFDAEVIDEGASVNIVVGARARSLDSLLQIVLVQLNFATGKSTTLYLSKHHPGSHFSNPKICGHIAFVKFVGGGRFINWKTKMHFDFVFGEPSPTSEEFIVIPIFGHILILTQTSSGGSTVSVLDIATLFSHWCDVATYPTPNIVPISKFEMILSEKITFPNVPGLVKWWTEFFVHESPLGERT
ncbi:hypothetical protein C8R45DRAFT_1213798 [Mycena sanguinolenta]|nr:hypothetical protein C8R45DRAFT_1213798 [Mycena sanguinolenta]